MKNWIAILLVFCFGSLKLSASPSVETYLLNKYPYHGKKLPDRFGLNDDEPPIFLYADTGSWETGIEHMKMFFAEHGWSYRTVLASDILAGILNSSTAKLLVMPGGHSQYYLSSLGEAGAEAVRQFVNGGGGYLGTCAGAFYATSLREGGVATNGAYGIGLLEGTAYDGTAVGTAPFKEGMLDFGLMPSSLLAGLQSTFRILLLGGPSFRYSGQEAAKKNLTVLMRFPQIQEPAMISFDYGAGRVFLSGPHLEIEEPRENWGPLYYDPDSEWPMLEKVVHYLLKS